MGVRSKEKRAKARHQSLLVSRHLQQAQKKQMGEHDGSGAARTHFCGRLLVAVVLASRSAGAPTAGCTGAAKVRAVHWDVEPHALWRWGTDRGPLSAEYLTLIDLLRSECLAKSTTGLKLAADIQMHYDLVENVSDPNDWSARRYVCTDR